MNRKLLRGTILVGISRIYTLSNLPLLTPGLNNLVIKILIVCIVVGKLPHFPNCRDNENPVCQDMG